MRACSTRYVDDYFYTRHADPLGDDLEPRLFVTSILLHAEFYFAMTLFRYFSPRDLEPRANVCLIFRGQNRGNNVQVAFTKYFHLDSNYTSRLPNISLYSILFYCIFAFLMKISYMHVTRLLGYEELYFRISMVMQFTKNTRSLVEPSSIIIT